MSGSQPQATILTGPTALSSAVRQLENERQGVQRYKKRLADSIKLTLTLDMPDDEKFRTELIHQLNELETVVHEEVADPVIDSYSLRAKRFCLETYFGKLFTFLY